MNVFILTPHLNEIKTSFIWGIFIETKYLTLKISILKKLHFFLPKITKTFEPFETILRYIH